VLVVFVRKQKILTGLVSCRCAAMDFRGHGDTWTVNDDDLSADTMARYRILLCLCHISRFYRTGNPCPPIDSILKLMTVWKITGKIIRTTIMVNYICARIMVFLKCLV